MRETLEQLLARATASGYVPTLQETQVMPKPVKLAKGEEFSFATTSAVSKYPWDEWFNPDAKLYPSGLLLLERSVGGENDKGTIVDIKEKKDFEVSVDAMVPKIKTAARKKYKVVRVSRRDNKGNKLVESLIISTRDMTAEERAAEDLLRAEEKAAKAAKGESEDEGDDTQAPSTDAA